jgi:hypothetical protein
MDSSLYVAGPNLVTVCGLRHGDDDEVKRKAGGRGRRKRGERRL